MVDQPSDQTSGHASANAGRWQFGLASVFYLIAAVGVVLAAVQWLGLAAACVAGILVIWFAVARRLKFPSRRATQWALAAALVSALWLMGLLGWGLMTPILVASSIYYVAKCRFVWLLALVFASPIGWGIGQGVWDYWHGQAMLRTAGKPGPEFWNLDPKLRCYWTTSGCEVTLDEWIEEDPYNYVVQALIRWFGPMPGAYTGPYPSREAAIAALAGAETVSYEDVLADRLTVGDLTCPLAAGEGERVAGKLGLPSATTGTQPSIRAIVWEDECLIVGATVTSSQPAAAERRIVLIDRRSRKIFAWYRVR